MKLSHRVIQFALAAMLLSLSFSVNAHESFRRVATYVDKILKSAKPADLPVEQPTKFEFLARDRLLAKGVKRER